MEHYEAIEGQLGGRSLAGGGTYLSGRVGPSTLFTRSVYANQSQFGGGVVLNVPAPGNAPTQVSQELNSCLIFSHLAISYAPPIIISYYL